MRVDTTLVEAKIHYPTDSSLLGDGVRVLTRVMQRVTTITGTAGATLRDRTRSVKLRLLAINRASRNKSDQVRRIRDGERGSSPRTQPVGTRRFIARRLARESVIPPTLVGEALEKSP